MWDHVREVTVAPLCGLWMLTKVLKSQATSLIENVLWHSVISFVRLAICGIIYLDKLLSLTWLFFCQNTLIFATESAWLKEVMHVGLQVQRLHWNLQTSEASRLLGFFSMTACRGRETGKFSGEEDERAEVGEHSVAELTFGLCCSTTSTGCWGIIVFNRFPISLRDRNEQNSDGLALRENGTRPLF